MIVVDASVVVDLLLDRPLQGKAERLFGRDESLHAPHLLDLEVTQALRRMARMGALSAARAREAVQDLAQVLLRRYEHGPLLPRVWELRHTLTAYDAAYLALAEALACPLYTRDAALAAVPGTRAPVELV